jgi:hypothetical protein
MSSIIHHQHALTNVQQGVLQQGEAAFMLNTFISFYAYASPQLDLDQSSPFPAIIDWLELTHNTLPHAKNISFVLRQGALSSIVNKAPDDSPLSWPCHLEYNLENPATFPDILFDLHLPTLGAPDPEDVYDQHTSDIYRDAISDLRLTWAFSQTRGNEITSLYMWAMKISDAYLSFIKERRPRALVILAHYCAMLYQMPRYWWTRSNVGDDILKIAQLLGCEWLPWIQYPLGCVKATL